MSTLAPNVHSEERNFTILQAIAIILLAAAVFAGVGVLVGKTFFWKSVNDTRIDQQLSFYQAKVDAEPKVPQNRVNLGYTYFLKGKNEDALRQFKIAADIDPQYAAAYYNMGTVYQEEKKYDEALEAFSKAAKLAPRDYKNFLMLGVVYNAQGNHKDAITALNRANAENPGSSDVIYQIGIAAEKTGDKEGAKELYKTALQFDPKYQDAKDALARLK